MRKKIKDITIDEVRTLCLLHRKCIKCPLVKLCQYEASLSPYDYPSRLTSEILEQEIDL